MTALRIAYSYVYFLKDYACKYKINVNLFPKIIARSYIIFMCPKTKLQRGERMQLFLEGNKNTES